MKAAKLDRSGSRTLLVLALAIGTAPLAWAGQVELVSRNALTGCGYLRFEGGRYELAPVARRWLLPGASQSLQDKMLLQFLEWDFVEHVGDFVRTGQPLDFHATMTAEEWGTYQRGMRSVLRPGRRRWQGGRRCRRERGTCWTSAARTATSRRRSAAATPACAR
jgi:hypothetical protein